MQQVNMVIFHTGLPVLAGMFVTFYVGTKVMQCFLTLWLCLLVLFLSSGYVAAYVPHP